MDGETLDSLRDRVERERAIAEETYLQLVNEADRAPIPPGGDFPNVSEGDLQAAEDRLAVLDHQLGRLNETLGRKL